MRLRDLFKELLAICILTPMLYNFCNAGLELVSSQEFNGSYSDKSYTCSRGFPCLSLKYCPTISYNFDHGTTAVEQQRWSSSLLSNSIGMCASFNQTTVYYSTNGQSCNFIVNCYEITEYTSLQCQTEYNLIPVSEVTSNYCKLNFDLISPSECPSGGGCDGSGSVVFSNVYVNNVLYPGGADIYLNVNERLATDISYNSQLMYVDIDFVGDEDYINGIVSINEYRPTSDDFTNVFVSGLTLIFPYIVITLFVLFIRKLIRKIFK